MQFIGARVYTGQFRDASWRQMALGNVNNALQFPIEKMRYLDSTREVLNQESQAKRAAPLDSLG
jgi:hypothetical protein